MYKGNIDGFTMWNRLLTNKEVSLLYNGGNSIEYPYNNKTSSIPFDSVGTNNGVLTNGATYTTGKIGNGFLLDGVNDYISLPDNSLNFTNDFSYSLWVNMSVTHTVDIFVSNYFDTGASTRWGYQIYHQGGKIRFSIGPGSTSTIIQGSTSVFVNNWYHIVVTKKLGSAVKMYINGTQETLTVVAGSINTNPVYNTTQNVTFGVEKNGATTKTFASFLNGKLDGISVWDKELTQSEVTYLYNSGNGLQL